MFPMHNYNQQAVTKAVYPVAGLGTRFLPATKASPKEMLVVIDKPLMQYAVEKAYAAGIRDDFCDWPFTRSLTDVNRQAYLALPPAGL